MGKKCRSLIERMHGTRFCVSNGHTNAYSPANTGCVKCWSSLYHPPGNGAHHPPPDITITSGHKCPRWVGEHRFCRWISFSGWSDSGVSEGEKETYYLWATQLFLFGMPRKGGLYPSHWRKVTMERGSKLHLNIQSFDPLPELLPISR